MRIVKITKRLLLAILITAIALLFAVLWDFLFRSPRPKPAFDGQRAYQDVLFQVSLGARTIGSPAHAQTRDWIAHTLKEAGWAVETWRAEWGGQALYNIIGRRGQGRPWIVLGAHYDSRFVADQDPDPARRQEPVLGANDGASGVAVLLELARVLPPDLEKQVWLVFFDAEDNGNYPGWDWILGSRLFVQALTSNRLNPEIPSAVVIVDMVGDADLQIYQEENSDPALTAEIWAVAAELGHHQFVPEYKYRIIDDHLPFLQAGIPAVDLIDFDYPFWHTTADTPEHVSAESLRVVGETLLTWLRR